MTIDPDSLDGEKNPERVTLVSFVPGSPAPWDSVPEEEPASEGETRVVTCGILDLLDGYRNVLFSGSYFVERRFEDGYCKVDVRQLEREFGVRLLGFLKPFREGRPVRIRLDDFTKARLIAHWSESMPKGLRSGDRLIKRAGLMANIGVEDLIGTVVESLERPSSGPRIFNGIVLEGVPPLPSALLTRRYGRLHAYAHRRLERIQLKVAAHSLLLLHPDLSSSVRVTMRVTFEPYDLDDIWP